MTPTHPAPGLAEAIAQAHDNWCKRKPGGVWRDHMARAVAAWLARPEMVELMALAAWRNEGGPAWDTCGDNYRAMMRAAIAAVVREAGNG